MKHSICFYLVIFSLLITSLQYHFGIGYSPDSNWYILLADRFGVSLDLSRRAVFAPLFPWSLGILRFIGLSTEASIFLYWFISYSILLFIFYRVTDSPTISCLAILAVLSNARTMGLFRMAWTELGYAVILLVAIYSLYELNAPDRSIVGHDISYRYRLLFVISLSLLPLQRYIGAYLCVYLGLVYLIYGIHGTPSLFSRAVDLFVAATPTVLVLVWNVLISGHFSGSRALAPSTFTQNIALTARVLYTSFNIDVGHISFCIICGFICILRRT